MYSRRCRLYATYSMGIYVKLTVLVFCGFVLHLASPDNTRQCFNIGEKIICYFRPNISSVKWNTAWKICKDLNSTLPVIPDKDVQDAMIKYFGGDNVLILPVWTAGRFTGGTEWKWLDGKSVPSKDVSWCGSSTLCPHETQAVLTSKLRYEARYPNFTHPYICSFTGSNCTNGSIYCIHWKAGCLKWEKSDRKRLNEARNKCIERGGDLATFNGQDDLQKLQTLLPSYVFNDPAIVYWIGLHRKWWIWNATDVQDIKYNLLKTYAGDTGPNCVFITHRAHEWMKDSCSNAKNVICQTVSYPEKISSTTNVILWSVTAIVSVAIFIVVLFVLIKKRGNVSEVKTDAGTIKTISNSVSPPQNTPIQYPDDTYATIDLDDDLENLNYENGPNPSTVYSKVENCDNSIYSEPADCDASEKHRSTTVYLEPYINTSATPVFSNLNGSSSDIIYSEVNKSQQKHSDELISPPIKMGPNGDIYTLPISNN